MKIAVVVAITILILVGPPLCADTVIAELQAFDRDHDGRLTEDELTAYLLATDADLGGDAKKARDLADDLLTRNPCNECHSMRIVDLAAIVPKLKTEPPKTVKPCQWLGFSRSLTDDIDPRQSETDVPAVAAYQHDKHAEGRTDWYNFQGTADVVKCLLNGGDRQTKPDIYGVKFGIEFDVDGSKKKNENSIDFGVPLSWEHVRSSTATITDLEVAFSPKYSTDRGFDRRSYEAQVDLSARIPRISAGMLTWLTVDAKGEPRATFFWKPTLSYEWADVQDAAGNADLLALKGVSHRVALGVQVAFRPNALSKQLEFSVKATERRDLTNDLNRWYIEPLATYDLTPDGGIGLTAMYQHGRKPPAFSAKDAWLIGVGIKR